MTFLVTFLEGLASFLSPCMLPLLPVYLGYFAGNGRRGAKWGRLLGFVLGFTVSFLLLGLLFSALGQWLARYRRGVELVCGLLMILFGLGTMEAIRLPWFPAAGTRPVTGVLSAVVFGLIYPVNLTPCVGAFLGSALALATASGSVGKGAALLLVYALGLGVPFLLSGFLMTRLEGAFSWVKGHYRQFTLICGGLLILAGLLTAAGVLGRVMAVFS